jgi:hypothetical protein
MRSFRYSLTGINALVLFILALIAFPASAQDLERHGEVTATDGQEVTVRLSEGISVSSGTAGTIYTTTTVGGEERPVRIAQVEVTEADGRTVIARISQRTQAPQVGFSASFEEAQRLGTLEVNAVPRTAEVFVDGSSVGDGAIKTTVPSGTRNLRAAVEGCSSVSKSVEVRQGETREVQFRLDCGTLRVNTVPQGARVLLNGEKVGTGPVETAAPTGQQRVKARAENCPAASKTTVVRRAAIREVQLQLDCTTLVVRPEPEEAEVYLDGQRIGPGEIREIVSPGTHQVKVQREGYESERLTVGVKSGETKRRAVSLPARPSQLSLKTTPSGATVFARRAGEETYQRLGKAPLSRREMKAGTYDVWARKKNYVGRQKELRLAPGEKKSWTLNLEFSMSAVRTLQSPSPEQNGRFGRCSGDDPAVSNDYSAVAPVGSVGGDKVPHIAVGACGETADGKDAAGHVHIFRGTDGELLKTLQSPNPTTGNDNEKGKFGASVVNIGDMSGGGVLNIAVGAPGDNSDAGLFGRAKSGAGRVYIIDGSNLEVRKEIESPDSDLFNYFGSGISWIGDVDEDENEEISVYSPEGSDESMTGEGKVYVLDGEDGSEFYKVESPNKTHGGSFGASVAQIGDFDGDEIADLAVGAPGETVDNEDGAGRAYIIDGAEGDVLQTFQSPNSSRYDDFGASTAKIGDVNGNGAILWTGRRVKRYIQLLP